MACLPIALSKIARDPALVAFFARGERDADPEPIVVPVRFPRPPFKDGAAARRELECVS
ncbi:hypothetical protein [Mesorhizobium sp. ORS 3428]|uniref:hypothetical protein n=1 Tax=Mesorhizobium sp. ORS 3428 TaxID=540997 RepID=UPI0012FFC8CD|nr:hypothetical protein [Mesorhizobium sp. ORS 3428]